MAREAWLYDSTGGNIFLAYLHVREQHMNIPPNWVVRARDSRKAREKELAKMLKSGDLNAANYIREWELFFKKECFYRGLRALLDMERAGKTKF
jgi:hypothetical protein